MKTSAIIIAVASAAGISYFALYTLGQVITAVSLAVNVVPLVAAWWGVYFVSRAQTTRQYIVRTILVVALPWAWLFVGSIYLALLRFQ